MYHIHDTAILVIIKITNGINLLRVGMLDNLNTRHLFLNFSSSFFNVSALVTLIQSVTGAVKNYRSWVLLSCRLQQKTMFERCGSFTYVKNVGLSLKGG